MSQGWEAGGEHPGTYCRDTSLRFRGHVGEGTVRRAEEGVAGLDQGRAGLGERVREAGLGAGALGGA